MKTMKDWGLANVHDETWPFGRGWQNQRFTANAVTPRAYPLIAYPKAWTPGTNGPVTGDAVIAVINEEKDFAEFKGKLRGKFVLGDADARGRRRISTRRAIATPTPSSPISSKQPPAGGGRGRGNFGGGAGVQPQEGAVLHRRRRRGGARLQPRRRRHGVRAGAAGRVARSEGPGAAGAGDADGRALRPHLADAREEDPGHAADGHRQHVLRRRPERLQHRRASCRAPTRPTRS